MPAYNFQRRFADDVRSGRKRQTIRADRKDGRAPKVGQTFFGYTGMRTKACERLCTGPIVQVRRIYMNSRGAIYVDSNAQTPASIETIAAADGFEHVDAFLDFFEQTHGFPFAGHIINWQ